MHRRTLLQSSAAAAATVPLHRVRLWAQSRELTAESIAQITIRKPEPRRSRRSKTLWL